MILKNALVFLENRFAAADVAVENGKIAAVGPRRGLQRPAPFARAGGHPHPRLRGL